MKLLYINKAYRGAVKGRSLYINQLNGFSNHGIETDVYVQLRRSDRIDPSLCPTIDKTRFIFLKTHGNLERLLFQRKVRQGVTAFEKEVEGQVQYDHLIGHTLFSDGAIAYELAKKYHQSYTVCVRDVDLNFFYPYYPYERKYMAEILRHAKNIICINPSLQEKLFEIIQKHKIPMDLDKIVVIPNGVDTFWLDTKPVSKSFDSSKKSVRLIFVGLLNARKNWSGVLKTTRELKERGYSVTVDIVGDGPDHEKIMVMTKQLHLSEVVTFHGWVQDKQRLLQLYRQNDILIVPSFRETFGLIYIEAMSQGLPVIYARKQGIDGYFPPNEVGCAVDPHNAFDMASKIEYVLEHYNKLTEECVKQAETFRWDKITGDFLDLLNR